MLAFSTEVNEAHTDTHCIAFNDTEKIGACRFNSTLLEQLSYQAVMDAFGRLVVGMVNLFEDKIKTGLTNTALLDVAQELESL